MKKRKKLYGRRAKKRFIRGMRLNSKNKPRLMMRGGIRM